MKRIIPVVVAVLLLLISQPTLAASLTLRAGTVEGSAGGTVEIPLEVAGATGLGAMQWEIVYDPAVLAVDSVTRGKQAGNALVEFRSDTPGRLFIAMATIEDVNGDGPVAVARFKVTGAQGQTSNLGIENANAWDGKTHRAIQVKSENGKFTIGGLPWWLPWLLLALGILLLLLLLILLLTRRRKPKPAAAYPQMQPPPVYYAPPPPPPGQPMPPQGPYMSPQPPRQQTGPHPQYPPRQQTGPQPQYPPRQQTGPQPQMPPQGQPPGQPQQGSGNYCRNCGVPNAPGATQCRNCRAPLI